jgi:putative transposase
MLKEKQSRKIYPSDVTDAPWALVAPRLPPAKSNPRGGRPRQGDLRDVLNTMRYLQRRGCPWDRLPHDLLPNSPVYDYCAPGRDDGTGTTVVTA